MAEYVERKRLLFLGLPWTFTKYTVTEDLITINKGLLKTTENDCYMYKVQDVQLNTTLPETLCGLGTIVCYTGDTTNPTLLLEHIRNAKTLKDYILETSEQARIKRRTLTTLDIGNGQMGEADELEEI